MLNTGGSISMQKAEELHGAQNIRSSLWLNAGWLMGWSTGGCSVLMLPELVG